jgi:hypothetical protein
LLVVSSLCGRPSSLTERPFADDRSGTTFFQRRKSHPPLRQVSGSVPRTERQNMTNRVSPVLVAMLFGSLTGLGVLSVSAQTPPLPKEVQSTFDTVEARVLRVFSAEEGQHRFVAYLVKWKDLEVIVSDPLANSHFQVGDKIHFIAQKVSLPGSAVQVSSLNFYLVSAIASERDRNHMDGDSVSSAEQARQMKIVQGDLNAATNETERFYALNRAAKNAMKDGKTENAHALATELERLAPEYKNDWNYGNAVQDANQVLGRIALSKGDVAEAKKRLLASADSKGSPQMNSFGPNMQLAKALLVKGEKDVVLEYFDRCAKFWEMGKDRLEAWRASATKGEMPEFGANLNN